MARPLKKGLDYFPFDVDFFMDDRIEYVSARFDEKGELIAVKLLCAIYKEGYFINWDDDKATIFSKRAGRNIAPSLAKNVVDELVKRGFFDKGIFNSFGIITSKGIQERYLSAAHERKEVEIIENYWLLDLPDETSKKPVYIIIRGNNGVNRAKNSKQPKLQGAESAIVV